MLTSGCFCFIPAVLLLFLIATEEDYRRVVETFGYYNFCFEQLVLTQKSICVLVNTECINGWGWGCRTRRSCKMKPVYEDIICILQAIKTRSGGSYWRCKSKNAGLVPRPSETTLMVRLQLVSYPVMGVSLRWPHGQKLVIEIFSHRLATA